MDYPRVSIVILNWNGWKDTLLCLESLYQIKYPNFNVILVDNGSEDDSVVKIKKWAEGKIIVKSRFVEYTSGNKPISILEYRENQVKNLKTCKKKIPNISKNQNLVLILNKKNYGFAKGNNIGIKFALEILNPKYILLLNNDTVVDPSFLIELVKVAETSEKIGITGPKMYYMDPPNMLWSAGGKINMYFGHWQRGMNEYDQGRFEKIEEVDFIAGACMLIKQAVFRKIGLIPIDYFLGWEDIDFCIKAKRNGFKCIYVPTARIWHKVSASYRRVKRKYLQVKLGARNRILFRQKYLSSVQFLLFLILHLLFIVPVHVIYYILYYNDLERIKNFVEGTAMGLRKIIKLRISTLFKENTRNFNSKKGIAESRSK